MRDRNGRYPKGVSGNPGGAPRKYPDANVSLIELLNKPEKIKQNGVEREYTAKEAMMLGTIQDVLGRKPSVRPIKLVVNAIIELQVARHKRDAPVEPKRRHYVIEERDADNAFGAMCLLGIAAPYGDFLWGDSDPRLGHDGSVQPPNCHGIKVKSWAVKLALSRKPDIPDDENWWVGLTQYTDKFEDLADQGSF